MEPKLLFVYCNLKKGKPFHKELKHLGATYLGEVLTSLPYPLIIRNGEAYLLPIPNKGLQVKGELYSITDPNDLARYFKAPKEAELSELVVESETLGENLAYTYIFTRRDLSSLFTSTKLSAKEIF